MRMAQADTVLQDLEKIWKSNKEQGVSILICFTRLFRFLTVSVGHLKDRLKKNG